MNRIAYICGLMTLSFSCYAGTAGRAKIEVPLPPLARVAENAVADNSWRQSGDISGSVAKVHGEFSAAMARGGWVLKNTIVLGRTPRHSELTLWKKGKDQVLLMIWEKRAGLCGFSWGVE